MGELKWPRAVFISLLFCAYHSLTFAKTETNYSCVVSTDQRRADCSGRHLDHVPKAELPSFVEEVDLSHNILQAISSGDFSHLPRLRVLQLQYNSITLIEDDAFSSNPLLENLNIFNNSLDAVPNKALSNLTGLRNLDMSNNFYSEITLDDVFSTFTRLQYLSLGGPFVKRLQRKDVLALRNLSLERFSFKSGPSLQVYEPGCLSIIQTKNMWFDVAIDNIPHVLPNILQDLAKKTLNVLRFRNIFEFTYYTKDDDICQGLQNINAQKLVFYRGKFNEKFMRMVLINLQVSPIKALELLFIDFARSPSFVDSGAGSSVTNLALDSLVLSDISNPDILRFDWRFTWFSKIRSLFILNVNFNFVPCDAWSEMGSVEVLDISKNQLKDQNIYNKRCDTKGTMPALHTFNISSNQLTSLSNMADLVGGFKHIQILDISNNQLNTENSISCTWNQNISTLIAHHNSLDVTCFKCLPTTVHSLDLSYCNLDQLDMNYFQKAISLRQLFLNDNKIKFIPSGWENPNLQSLTLDGNSFGLMSLGSFKDMPSLSKLKAGNNPYHCSCDLYTFIQETTTKGKVNITDWPGNYKCYHPEELLNTMVSEFFPGHVTCDIRLVILISVVSTAGLVFGMLLMCYLFDIPWYTKATYQILRAKYRAHKEGAGLSRDYAYHAFISYSHSDAEWVKEQLLPCLENCKPPYQLCIHERDFMPGKWIIDNIIDNIENSRKVIFVLSKHFVNSEWCNYELYFAQQRAIGKTFTDVILVLKEPISPESLPSKYCKLKKMLSTKTYLQWPQQIKQQTFFWAQLKSVLGKPTHKQDRPCNSPGEAQEHERPSDVVAMEVSTSVTSE
ncbi:toll-like receptor 18 [Denticeps clupeoides]|uniref:TIR domain-containing protein n=1 Tax=Denticeps clupeoides TaxID=299321 RepID=A0AAY4DPK9_9TELE|nr:toll-like receptor 2 type-2 [Denticeps clupeoides]